MRQIVVAGDLVIDDHLARLPFPEPWPAEPLDETIQRRERGGAWYLAERIRAAVSDCPDVEVQGPPTDDPVDTQPGPGVARTIAIWAPHESGAGRPGERVWRIERFLGVEAGSGEAPIPPPAKDGSGPDVLVLGDWNLGFRRQERLWPALPRNGDPGAIVLQTVAPLGRGPLWERLISERADQLTVVTSVRALRARQAAISDTLSWDRTIEDLEREFRSGSSSGDLGRARRVVVVFSGEGVALYDRTDGGRLGLERFVYHPEELAGNWHQRRPGETFGATSLLTAAVVRHALDPATAPFFVVAGRALTAIRANHDRGRGRVEGRTLPELLGTFGGGQSAADFEAILHPRSSVPASELPEAAFRAAFPRELLGENPGSATSSDLLRDVTGPGYEYVLATAMQVALQGIERTLDSVPKARYGAFLTVDREEIERINEIRRLILSYQANPADRRPLSLAVFGPPGSGKSFAIKQVAADLFDSSQAVLEFNATQFASRDDLLSAFEQVRDATVRGQVPLVFWDEFDTRNLEWLAEFLAPMQDAEFRSSGMAHPLGKVIFVFAGGTAATFQEFDRTARVGTIGDRFRQAKGPDFVSRLRGYVNVKGPNPNGAVGDEVVHLIRRAILLRSVVERSYPRLVDPASGRAAIEASVIRGFLRAERFYHGARSLEAIVGMSALAEAPYFGVTELPSPELLSLHVTPDFADGVQTGELEEATIELLAEAAHHAWLETRRTEGWTFGPLRDDTARTHPLMVEYDQLSEADRERNRHSARVTLAKLHQIGYQIESRSGIGEPVSVPRRLSDLERRRLVEIEHRIWLRDHLLRGYAYGSRTDERLRLHPDVAPFEGMTEVDQRLDLALIDAIPDALWKGGYVLVRGSRKADRIVVGVTGHRVLTDTDEIIVGIRQALQRIRETYGNQPLTSISMLAEGADRLVVEEVLRDPSGRNVAVLPFNHADYAAEFGPRGSPSRLHFEALLARTAEVLELPPRPTPEDSYQLAGQLLVDRCDVLLAVWDGGAALGLGGTAHVVDYARAKARPIVIVRAGNRDPANGHATTLGVEQGIVVEEGLPG